MKAKGRRPLRRARRGARATPKGGRLLHASKNEQGAMPVGDGRDSNEVVLGKNGPATAVAPAPLPRITNPLRRLAAFFGFALAMISIGGIVIRTVHAATFVSPTLAPPGGNVPLTIWNRTSAAATQTNAAIDIDGGGPAPATATGLSVGKSTLDLGSAAGGQNVIYGVASYTTLNASASPDYLMLLQTANAGVYTNRLSADRDGNLSAAGTVSVGGPGADLGVATVGQNLIYADVPYAKIHPTGDYLMLLQTDNGAGVYTTRFSVSRDGNLKSLGCFGSTFVGLTSAAWPGNVGSYYAADAKCAGDYAGAHVCRVDEMIDSVQCSTASDPVRTIASGSAGWINGGPPGDPAKNASDCAGWTSITNVPVSNTAFGRVWVFNGATGGSGTDTTCNTPGGLKYACCR